MIYINKINNFKNNYSYKDVAKNNNGISRI